MNAPTPEATTTTRTEQADYQVRLDWGLEGLTRLAPADLVVAVDVLGAATRAVVSLDQPSAGDATTIRSLAEDARDAASSMDDVVAEAEAGGAQVVLGCLRNATAVARWCVQEQVRRGGRTSIALIALPGADHRMAVENLLGAGAIIAALSDLGTDHTSPEAAAACEAALGLRRAVGHLASASVRGRELTALGKHAFVAAAAQRDASETVPIVSDGVVRAGQVGPA